jgi:hypothetical protein
MGKRKEICSVPPFIREIRKTQCRFDGTTVDHIEIMGKVMRVYFKDGEVIDATII